MGRDTERASQCRFRSAGRRPEFFDVQIVPARFELDGEALDAGARSGAAACQVDRAGVVRAQQLVARHLRTLQRRAIALAS